MSMTVIGYYAFNHANEDNSLRLKDSLLVANDKIELRKLSKKINKAVSWVIEQIYPADIMHGMDHGDTFILTEISFNKFRSTCYAGFPEYFTYDRVNMINIEGRDFVKLN